MTKPQKILVYFVVFFVSSFLLPFKLWALCMIFLSSTAYGSSLEGRTNLNKSDPP